MAIPKVIYQTFKSGKLPLITRWHVYRLKKKNPDYQYEFYDDTRIESFIESEYGSEIFDLYKRINIGAAKADFFRYAVLYKRGGIYLDIDSLIVKKLDDFILPSDEAIVSNEGHPGVFVQWGLIYNAGHPFLKRTLDKVIDNLKNNRYPHNVHKMTGPTAYTEAVKECLAEDPSVPHRFLGTDYNGYLVFSYPMSKFFLYKGKQHWKKESKVKPVLKERG